MHFISSCALKTAKYIEIALIIKFKFGCQSSLYVSFLSQNQSIVSSKKTDGGRICRINIEVSQIKTSK